MRHLRYPIVRRGGFTLLELIVAMAMVAILATSLYASLRIAFRAQASAERAIEPVRTASVALDLIRADLENAIPPGDVLAGSFVGTDGTDDRGLDGDDLVFYGTSDAPEHPSGNGEIKSIELMVIVPDGSSDHVLVRHVTRNLLSQIEVDPDEEVICRGVSGFNLRYYDGTQWLDTWESSQQENKLPAAVEVTLELDRPGSTADQQPQTRRYVRIIPIACSTVSADSGLTVGGTP
jgi:type II secretion system protein J